MSPWVRPLMAACAVELVLLVVWAIAGAAS